MKRKVIKQGNGTLTITLPKNWTNEIGLEGGDEVEIDVEGRMLAVTSSGEAHIEKKEIDISGNEWSAARLVSALYKQGADEIDIRFSDRVALKKIQKEVKDHLMTFEIVDQGMNSCHLKSLATEHYSDFDKMLAKSFQVGLSLAKNSLEHIKADHFEELDELIALEKANNRFTSFCQRLIIKKGYATKRKGVFMYLLLWQLEKVVDNYKYLVQHIAGLKKKPSPGVMKLYGEVNDYFDLFYHLFFKGDIKKMQAFASEKDKLVKKSYELLASKKNDPVVLHQLLSVMGDVFDLSGPFYALKI